MAKYLVDEYGEVLGEFSDDVSIRIYNPLNAKRIKLQNKLFYKFYKDSILVFTNNLLSKQVITTLFKMIRLLDFGTNEFVNLNGLPANMNQLASFFELKDKTFYNHIKQLEKLDIVRKVKNGRNKNIIINPFFIQYGTSCTDESLTIFANSVWSKNSTYSKKKQKIN